MIPNLARRGTLILVAGLLFVVAGAVHTSAVTIALGGVVISGLMTAYLGFFPTAILLRRKKIELSWWIPAGELPGGAVSVDHPFPLHIAFRNHGHRALRVLGADIVAGEGLNPPGDLEARVPGGRAVEVAGPVVPLAAGYHVLHGARLRFGDMLGLFEVRAYFPNHLAVKVFPRRLSGRAAKMSTSGRALHEQVGLHRQRRRGHSGDLREIREHAHGDPFKFIAWKASARRGRLMVRDVETEVVSTQHILVDMAGSMRAGSAGRTKLDYAIDLAAALAQAASLAGDRAGLTTFDGRVYDDLAPSSGHHHILRMTDRLIDTRTVVDEDLTAVTNGELVATVARYLAHQEGVDVRLRYAPALDDPAWERIHAGPNGELYDMRALGTILESLLKVAGQSKRTPHGAPDSWWRQIKLSTDSDPQLAQLRLFCRLRGIELPYRSSMEVGRRSQGLSEALDAASRVRADILWLISDLRGLTDRPGTALRSLDRICRRGTRVVVVAPFGPRFLPTSETKMGDLVTSLLHRDERTSLDAALVHLRRRGVTVVEVGPSDGPEILARRLSRASASRRRAA